MISRASIYGLTLWCLALTVYSYLQTRESMRMLCVIQHVDALGPCTEFLTVSARMAMLYAAPGVLFGLVLLVIGALRNRQADARGSA